MIYTASCLCNGIQLNINAELNPIMVCHCKQCQKHKGLLLQYHSSTKSDLEIVQGENLLQAYSASLNKRECSVKPAVHLSGVNV